MNKIIIITKNKNVSKFGILQEETYITSRKKEKKIVITWIHKYINKYSYSCYVFYPRVFNVYEKTKKVLKDKKKLYSLYILHKV